MMASSVDRVPPTAPVAASPDIMERIGAAIRSWEEGALSEQQARARIALLLRDHKASPRRETEPHTYGRAG